MSTPTEEIRRVWAGERGVVPTLLAGATAPLSVLFGAGVRFRNLLYDQELLSARKAILPVVSVGNLAVGGTGKTPVSAWIAQILEEAGWHPAIILRGYGEDEVLLHRRWNPEVPVVCARRRIHGVLAASVGGSDVAVLDDGFQHRAVHRDLDVVLCSPAHPLPSRLLPRGPFREPLRALRRADHILVTAKGPHEFVAARQLVALLLRVPGGPPVDLFPFRYGGWQELDGKPAARPGGLPLVVTSVAEPDAFLRQVREEVGGMPRHLPFRDHHPFSEGDARRIARVAGSGWVATTEKDAVKLEPFRELLPEARVLPLVPEPDPRLAGRLLERIGPLRRELESR